MLPLTGYDENYWNQYALENETRYNRNFADFVGGLAMSLRCHSVLEVGCGTGIDLRSIADNIRILGVDTNILALQMARIMEPRGTFQMGDIRRLPLDDSCVDIVFTHKLLNYLDDDTLDKGMAEMYRVSKKYVMSCEMYHEDEVPMHNGCRYRNMARRWNGYNTVVVSNVQMHCDIDSEGPYFVLVRKI